MSTVHVLRFRARPVALALALVVALVPWVSIGVPVGAAVNLDIETVTIDLDAQRLTITGTGFDNPQDTTVLFAGQPISIVSETSTMIEAALPNTVTPGVGYLVDVIVTGGSGRSGEFDLTVTRDDELEAEIDALQASLAARQAQVAALEALLVGVTRGIDPVTHIDTIVLSGANLEIVNGTGVTDAANGAGNLVIGYNTGTSGEKTGSHFLLVGDQHRFTTTSGIASGTEHVVEGDVAAFLGGANQVVQFAYAAGAAGGVVHAVLGDHGFVGGGVSQAADGEASFVGGGDDNASQEDQAGIAGGYNHRGQGERSFVGGGSNHTTSSECAYLAGTNVNC
jgi:hypothetical protein